MVLMREFLKHETEIPLSSDYIGVVEDNKDPEKLGRCRIRVHGLYDDIPTADLPWAVPEFGLGAGVRGSFCVPEINTVVNVNFDCGDRYEPRYRTKALDKDNSFFESDKNEDYPNSIILYESANGDSLKINRAKGEFTLRTGSGGLVRINENGDIEISNGSSENGDMNVKLKGNFLLDNKLANVKIVTGNHDTESFGSVSLKSNGSVSNECLDDYTITTNRTVDIKAGTRTSIRSREEFKTESISAKIQANEVKIEPSTISSTTVDQNGTPSVISPKFSFVYGGERIVATSVSPNVLGGPFNCIAFDPLTGMPHQGTEANSILNPASFVIDNAEIAAELAKVTAQITAKYTSKTASDIQAIVASYASIDSQAQMLMGGAGSASIIAKNKADDISKATEQNASLMAEEIERATAEILTFLEKPIFGTGLEPTTPEGQRQAYKIKLTASDAVAKLDLTGKTTAKDIAGAGDGLITDEVA